MKVLALDNLQKVGIDVFVREGIEVDVKGKMTPEELAAVITATTRSWSGGHQGHAPRASRTPRA